MATEGRTIPERKRVKEALRAAGLSTRQVDLVVRAVWKELIGDAEAENAELREKLRELQSRLNFPKNDVA
jgi:hypothetical protein